MLFFDVIALGISLSFSYYYFIPVLLILYVLYYKKYGFYIFKQKEQYTQKKHRIGKTLPPYPNGWFVLMFSRDIKIGESKYIDTHGESLAVFRANNGKVYVVSAYCPHLGANLGVGGEVVHDSCIKCPFHGWTFDGETGNCVIGKDLRPKEGIKYEYEFDENSEQCVFKSKGVEKVKLKTFFTQEKCGYIFIWFHAQDDPPAYEPLDVSGYQNRLCYRGTSINKINCHVSDIAENGGDVLHFRYVHTEIIPLLVTGYWDASWTRGDDPLLREKLKHKDNKLNEYRTRLLDQFVTEENKKYIGVIHLDNEISILNLPIKLNFFFLTGFQVGPGLVYLFIKGKFFETFLVHYVQTKDKYDQKLYHDIYCNYMAPYWFSALQLRLEVRQVLNDCVIWDNKKFAYSAFFNNNDNLPDNYLIQWRQWYSQYYKGCYKKEIEKRTIEW
jgi:cholesterol 7-dehydrogenase